MSTGHFISKTRLLSTAARREILPISETIRRYTVAYSQRFDDLRRRCTTRI